MTRILDDSKDLLVQGVQEKELMFGSPGSEVRAVLLRTVLYLI